MVGEDSVPYFVYACVYITCLLSLECICFGYLEGNAFRFGGPEIFLDWFRWRFGILLVSGQYLATLCSVSIDHPT